MAFAASMALPPPKAMTKSHPLRFASALPVWLLLAPRDYLSAFMKIGTITLFNRMCWSVSSFGKPAMKDDVNVLHRMLLVAATDNTSMAAVNSVPRLLETSLNGEPTTLSSRSAQTISPLSLMDGDLCSRVSFVTSVGIVLPAANL